MKDFLEGRQVAIDGSKEELNRLLGQMLEALGDGWIDKEKGHILRNLWKRKDFLATNELLNLAYSIDKIKKYDEKWLEGQIKKVKSDDVNNVKGALFEIMGFSYLMNDSYNLELASEGNPGIDGIITFNNNKKINISMKNFGISHFEKDYKKGMDLVKKYLLELLKKHNLLTLQCTVLFNKYPSPRDFEILKERIKYGVELFAANGNQLIVENEIAEIMFTRLKDHRFTKGFNSYILFALSPLHKNEFKNLIDKLEEACVNIDKQKKVEEANEINGIWIHLHENAAIKSCQEIMQEYLNENTMKPISFINLYCPCAARNSKENTTTIVHTIMPVASPIRYTNWIKQNGISFPEINFFVGLISTEISPRKRFVDGREEMPIDDKYLYQCGEIYEDAVKLTEGTILGDIVSIAPGIIVNSVLEKDGKRVIFKGKFPEDEHLEIM